MKWVLWAGGAVVGLAGIAAVIGAMLPVRHTASRKAHFKAAPEAIWATITGPPDWRPDVKRFGALPDENGRKRWWEEDSHNNKVTYELLEEVAPARRVTRIADRSLPFGGTWTVEVAPAGSGSEVSIREDGEIYNVIFRFVARFFMGYTSTIKAYLRNLGTKLGEAAELEG